MMNPGLRFSAVQTDHVNKYSIYNSLYLSKSSLHLQKQRRGMINKSNEGCDQSGGSKVK